MKMTKRVCLERGAKRPDRGVWRLVVMALCLQLAGVAVHAAGEMEGKLTAFFKKYLDESFVLRPMDATRLGDHRFDDQLDDVSPQARARWVEHTRETLESLPKAVQYPELSRAGQVDFEILQHELATSLWLAQNTHPFEEDPRVYNDYINDSVYLLLTQSTLPNETNVAHAIARLADRKSVV